MRHSASFVRALVWQTAVMLGVALGASSARADANTDFQTRCAQSGVVKCVAFDAPSEISGIWGAYSGIYSGDSTAVIDSSVKASGNGALKFTIPANSGANSSGGYWTNFSKLPASNPASTNLALENQFGEGDEFYVQWRQRFSSEFITTQYAGAGGWKQAIIGEGDNPGCTASTSISKDGGGFCASTCTQLEVVTQNTGLREIPQMYHSCGVKDEHYEPFEIVNGSSIHMQYSSAVPNCLYPGPYSSPSCVAYQANQWMTFQVHVKIGTWYKNDHVYHEDSVIHLWVAKEGEPAVMVMDRSAASGTGYDLVNLSPSISKYGKVWLLPYDTGKDSGQTNATAYTWYDELIISHNRIADPNVPAAPAPAAPQNLHVQ